MSVKRTNSDGFMLRLPDGMRERIKQASEANGRSMNAEIVHRLEASLSSIWPRPQLPEEYTRRVLASSAHRRVAFEAEVLQASIDLIEKFFPRPDDAMLQMQIAFEQLMSNRSHSDEETSKQLWADFGRLMEKIYIETLESG